MTQKSREPQDTPTGEAKRAALENKESDLPDLQVVTGLFSTPQQVKQAAGALNRHRFAVKDMVRIIDQDKISPADGVVGREEALENILKTSGLAPSKCPAYAERIRQGDSLLIVRTESRRAEEALDILRQAQAEEPTIQPS